MGRTLICIDFINDIASPDGKLSGKGYYNFAEKCGTLRNVRSLQDRCRTVSIPVFHVRVGFDAAYLNHPKHSPIFGAAEQASALRLGSWGTEFVELVAPIGDELVINKVRVSAFYGTPLEAALRAIGTTEVILAGVATDLAVQSAAREAHDRDFAVTIPHDCCAAANDNDHTEALRLLEKVAKVIGSADLDL